MILNCVNVFFIILKAANQERVATSTSQELKSEMWTRILETFLRNISWHQTLLCKLTVIEVVVVVVKGHSVQTFLIKKKKGGERESAIIAGLNLKVHAVFYLLLEVGMFNHSCFSQFIRLWSAVQTCLSICQRSCDVFARRYFEQPLGRRHRSSVWSWIPPLPWRSDLIAKTFHNWILILQLLLFNVCNTNISHTSCCFQDLSVSWTALVLTNWWTRWGNTRPSTGITLHHASFYWTMQKIPARNFTSDRITMLCQ